MLKAGWWDDTYSVESSVTRYRIENGRRYHAYKDGIYWAPNDDRQNESLDISHHKYLLILEGKLTAAPIEKNIEVLTNSQRCLDVGTGTGIWAIDFADEHPKTTVIGTDLSPIQPDSVPPNCRFEVDDCRDTWPYPPTYFDYVHIRALLGSIDSWDDLYAQVYKHLKPGGYIEHIEGSIWIKSDDETLAPDSPIVRFCKLYEDAGRVTGQTFQVAEIIRENLERAGFVNVVEKVIKTPIGGWPADPRLRELGQWTLLGFLSGLEGYALATLTRALKWSLSEVHVFLAQVRRAIRDRYLHSYHEVRVVYAQKPE
ncbi:S-adenosyl-L-methionine-dependent methyltransferase [Acephala macrosclerotiorum]|nr:S-adenosyl-L-methionine-dependent methyltransferase [Acephala macrosclerotiorum]